METLVRKTGDMVRILEIKAEASELETDVRIALKKQQSMTTMRGFRPGCVPLALVRRLHREEVKDRVVNNLSTEVFDDMIKENPQYNLLRGAHEIYRDYELDGDLKVQIEFYVLPEIQLADFTGHVLEIDDYEVQDIDIDIYIKSKMAPSLLFRSLKEGEKIGEGIAGFWDRVKFERVNIDRKTGLIVLDREASEQTELFDYWHIGQYESEEYERIGDALRGRSVGDKIFLEEDSDISVEILDLDNRITIREAVQRGFGLDYEVRAEDLDNRITICEAYRVDWIEPDDEWADKISGGQVSTAEELNNWVREELNAIREEVNAAKLENLLKNQMMKLYPFSIPDQVWKEMVEIDPKLVREVFGESDEQKMWAKEQMHWVIFLHAVRIQLIQVRKETEPSPSSEYPTYSEIKDILLEQFEVKRHYPRSDIIWPFSSSPLTQSWADL